MFIRKTWGKLKADDKAYQPIRFSIVIPNVIMDVIGTYKRCNTIVHFLPFHI